MSSTNPGSIDTMLDVLSDPYRRRVLLALSEYGRREEEEFTIHSLASPRLGDEEPDVLEIRLYHTHLPKLAKVGYVEWSSDGEAIRRGPHFDDVEPLLETLIERETDLPFDFP